MELLVLDQSFVSIALVDHFTSLIWTDRYQEYGDFELTMPMNSSLLTYIKKGNYLWLKDSEHAMIIDRLEIDTDVDSGARLIVSGKSLESILNRRIVWNQTRLRGKIDPGIKRLMDDAFIKPTDEQRKVENFVYQLSEDEAINDIVIDKQYSGVEIYEVVVELVKFYGLGFKMVLNNNNQFVFSLYKGKDRTYAQFKNPYVIFSPNFDNIISSEYFETNENEKNIALVAGEDKNLGNGRQTLVIGEVKGLERRELYVDARDIQSEVYDDEGNESQIPEYEYLALLRARGLENMLEYKSEIAFTGEAETSRSFKYGRDFFMGDIVQVEDGYGHEHKARIIELIFSQDESGVQIYPTFQVVEEAETA